MSSSGAIRARGSCAAAGSSWPTAPWRPSGCSPASPATAGFRRRWCCPHCCSARRRPGTARSSSARPRGAISGRARCSCRTCWWRRCWPAAPRSSPSARGSPAERGSDREEVDPVAWPRKVTRRYSLIPTICFNCEAACGLLAYVDQDTLAIQKFEGNPVHPGSRGRNCAKGPATLNQVQDPERILYPMRRAGPRGGGQWQRVTWDEALDDIAGRIRKALIEGRPNEIMYHLGRPGHELVYLQRVLHAWGIDGHNSHTNVCSSSARAGYEFWHGMDRPSPAHANPRLILPLSSHLETGHSFNPHPQRI